MSRPLFARLVLAGGLAVFAVAFIGLVTTGHRGLRTSADSTDLVPFDDVLIPLLVGILLVRLVPPRLPRVEPLPGIRRAVAVRQMWQAITIAVAVPVTLYLVVVVGVPDETVGTLWALSKPIVFLLLPWGLFRGAWVEPRELWLPPRRWQWWGPAPALLAFAALTSVGPFAGLDPDRADYPDPVVLAIGATITFLTANVIEELFYRVTLQSRLAAVLGQWPAIVVSSLLFALLHLPTHGQTSSPWADLPLTLGAIIVYQGTVGLFLGYLWARYRNVWAQITAHSIINTLPLLLL